MAREQPAPGCSGYTSHRGQCVHDHQRQHRQTRDRPQCAITAGTAVHLIAGRAGWRIAVAAVAFAMVAGHGGTRGGCRYRRIPSRTHGQHCHDRLHQQEHRQQGNSQGRPAAAGAKLQGPGSSGCGRENSRAAEGHCQGRPCFQTAQRRASCRSWRARLDQGLQQACCCWIGGHGTVP